MVVHQTSHDVLEPRKYLDFQALAKVVNISIIVPTGVSYQKPPQMGYREYRSMQYKNHA